MRMPLWAGKSILVASPSRKEIQSATPAFLALDMDREMHLGSLSEPRIWYFPWNSLSFASVRTCPQRLGSIQAKASAENRRFMPGARFLAISAASMGMVPEPQKGSQIKSRPR